MANPARTPRTPDVELSPADIRAVTAFTVACATEVLPLFEAASPDDPRPREALDAAAEFASGADRSRVQRLAAPAAHRASKEVTGAAVHAAMACGDAAASAYLHPLAEATQVGHILRGPAHAAVALTQRAEASLTEQSAVDLVLGHATSTVADVLRRYPPAAPGGSDVARVMCLLDGALRAAE